MYVFNFVIVAIMQGIQTIHFAKLLNDGNLRPQEQNRRNTVTHGADSLRTSADNN